VRQCRAAALAVVLAACARILPVTLLQARSAPGYLRRQRVIAAWLPVSAAAPARLTWWLPGASRRANPPSCRRDEHVYPQ
jgi:hypothetical protein